MPSINVNCEVCGKSVKRCMLICKKCASKSGMCAKPAHNTQRAAIAQIATKLIAVSNTLNRYEVFEGEANECALCSRQLRSL